MARTYPANKIAQWFINWARAEDADLSNLKLQKLLYFAQGWHLAETDGALFTEPIQAWSHGPVVKAVYRAYRDYGSRDLTEGEGSDEFAWDDFDPDDTDLLIKIWNTYAPFSAWQLREMTHEQPPWRDHFNADERDIVIPQKDIRDYFRSLQSARA